MAERDGKWSGEVGNAESYVKCCEPVTGRSGMGSKNVAERGATDWKCERQSNEGAECDEVE